MNVNNKGIKNKLIGADYYMAYNKQEISNSRDSK